MKGKVDRDMLIGEVARDTGFRVSAIRYYESLGLLPPATRVGGRRHYTADALERLSMIRFAQAAGFTLAEVKHLLDGAARRPPPVRWRKMAARKIGELGRSESEIRAIRRLLATTLSHPCPKLVERGMALLRAGHNQPRARHGVSPNTRSV